MKRSALQPGCEWRVQVVPVTFNAATSRYLHEATHRCALLWNHAVEQMHQFWSLNGRDPSLTEMRHLVAAADPELLRLHAHTKQAISDDLFEAVRAYRSLRCETPRARAPWRKKSYRPLSFTARYGWKARGQNIVLSFGRGNQSVTFTLPEVLNADGRRVDSSEWREGRLCWDRDNRVWLWHVVYQHAAPPALDPANTLAIDEGIINPVTLCTETEGSYEVVVVNGRHARAVKHRRNTSLSALVRKQARCSKGSRKWRRYEAARKRSQGKAKRSLRNFNHHVARHVAAEAQARDTGRIVVGDVRGIELRTTRAEKRRVGKNQRRRLSQWGRGVQERYVAEKTGVGLQHIPEDYSSKTCPACLTRNRPSGRNYRCRECGFTCHRDAVGALNIYQRSTLGAYAPIDPAKPVRVRYLRAIPSGALRSKRQDPAHVAGRSAGLPTLTPSGREDLVVRCGQWLVPEPRSPIEVEGGSLMCRVDAR